MDFVVIALYMAVMVGVGWWAKGRAKSEADFLVAFYQHSYEEHVHSVRKGGIVLFDSSHVTPNEAWEEDYHHLPVAISALTIESIASALPMR